MVAIVGAGYLLLLNASQLAAARDASDTVGWPQFLGPSGDNKSAETNVNLDWPPEGPKLLWTRRLGESYGIGSVREGRYFQFDFNDGEAQLLCLDSETGEQQWRYAYPSDYVDLYNYNSGPRASPVIDGNRIYLFGVEGQLTCVNADDGKSIWQVNTNKKFGVIQNFFGVGSTPIVYQDLLIAMIGGSPLEDQAIPPGRLDRVSGNGTAVVAFDKLTGKVRYRLHDDLASYASPKLAEMGGRTWCFMFLRGGLLAFDPATGKQADYFPWRARILESVNASTPVVWDDYVFISETYGPGAALLRFVDGKFELVWSDRERGRHKAMMTHWNTPIFHEGYLYGSSGRHMGNAELRCIAAKTGRVMWSQPHLTRSSLLYVDRHLVCLSEDGTLRLLRANPQKYDLVMEFVPKHTGGNQRGSNLLKPPAWAAPILSDGLLYVRGRDLVACFDLRIAD